MTRKRRSCNKQTTERKIFSKTRRFLNAEALAEGTKNEASGTLERMSMHYVPPVLRSFAFPNIHIVVGVNAIFRFEPMHNL